MWYVVCRFDEHLRHHGLLYFAIVRVECVASSSSARDSDRKVLESVPVSHYSIIAGTTANKYSYEIRPL
jgi:hypothetical protein